MALMQYSLDGNMYYIRILYLISKYLISNLERTIMSFCIGTLLLYLSVSNELCAPLLAPAFVASGALVGELPTLYFDRKGRER